MNIEYYTVDQFLYRANIAESKNLMPFLVVLRKISLKIQNFNLFQIVPLRRDQFNWLTTKLQN